MDLFTYLFRSMLILLAFVSLYQLALHKDSHFSLIRLFLLIGIFATLFIPLAEIPYQVIVEKLPDNEVFKEVQEQAGSIASTQDVQQIEFNWLRLLYWVYLIGVISFVGRLLFSLSHIWFLYRESRIVYSDGIKLCLNSKVSEPFTFGSLVFIDNETYLKAQKSEIIAHEKVHLMQKHWIDVVLSELLITLQWFNPLAWYYNRIVKQNLEFLADRGVLNQGYSIEEYIQSIICVTMGAEASVLANHFRFSQNKRRLKMMKNDRKSKWRQLKLLLVLPLIGGFLWAFSEPVYQFNSTEKEELAENSLNKGGKKVTISGFVGVMDTLEIKNPETGLFERKIIEGEMPGVSIVLKGETIGTVSDRSGKFKIEADENDILVFSFVGFKTIERKVEEGKALQVYLEPTSYELDPAPFRDRYKGQMTPPPPPPVKSKKNEVAPPPPPAKEGEPIFYVVESLPSYNGGMETYFANLYTSIEQAKKKNKLSGVVKVQFVVNTKGEVTDVRSIGKRDKKSSEIAEKIVANLDDWMPGKQRGKAVNCKLIVPVEFK